MYKLSRPLYHGTSNAVSVMVVGGYGLNAPVYLTSDKRRAEHYAKAATAYLEETAQKNGGKLFAEGYAILTFTSLPNKEYLCEDNYSPNEPDQYIYKGKILGLRHFTVERHSLEVDADEHLRLQCFAIGMWSK